MKIGLIDVDGRNFPNLPLMKISSYFKSRGGQVEWYSPWNGHYDAVYMSKVFSFTPDFVDCINADEVHKGGTGYCVDVVDGKEVYHPERDTQLPAEIEHSYPDYSLYPKLTQDTAYGFLTRGCPRGCNFCIVGKKEGRYSLQVAELSEFWRGQKNIVLCDPNILAARNATDLLAQLRDTKAKIDFNQGLDIRLMTEEKARLISELKISEIHFAWDRYEDRDKVLPKLQLFADCTKQKPYSHNAIVYTIVNYDTTLEQDLDRIYTLRDMGYWPYVMIYNKAQSNHIYTDLQRWVNNRFIFGACKKFEDYNKKSL